MLCLQAARGSALSLLTVLCFCVRDAFFSFERSCLSLRACACHADHEIKRRRATADPRGASCSRQRERIHGRLPSGREHGRSHGWRRKCTNSHCASHRSRVPPPHTSGYRRCFTLVHCSLAQLSGARDPKPFLRPVTVTRSTVEPWVERDETALPVPVRRASLTNLGPRSSAHSRGWGAHAPPKIPCRGLTVRPL